MKKFIVYRELSNEHLETVQGGANKIRDVFDGIVGFIVGFFG